jgi:putative Holliday junction resolvase
MRILAIDPGEKRIGLALSDPTGIIASPLTVLEHISRAENANRIIEIAQTKEVGQIIVGYSTDDEGNPTFSGRQARRLAAQINFEVLLWEEAFSTKEAQQSRIEAGIGKQKRKGHQDQIAATIILQSYLEHLRTQNNQLLKENE